VPGAPGSRDFRILAACLGWGALVAWLGWAGPAARGDDFGRIVGPTLFDVPKTAQGGGGRHLSVRSIESLPEVVRGERSALIVASTDQGNLAKLLVSQGLRSQPRPGGRPVLVPVISLDRFETIDAGDRVSRKARGRDVVLFDGFEFDLDTGQVVPAGFGGDIAYSSRGADGPELTALGQNSLYAIDKPVPIPGPVPGRPSSGPAVVPSDFNGRYTLVSNGQMSGELDIAVAADGAVTGRLRSDRNGSVYPVTGKVPADLSRRIQFEIKFPRTRQTFEGLLWTEEKNVFAGTVQILEHPYSFIAVREGASLVPESIDASSPPRSPAALRASSRVITLEADADRYTLDGVPKSTEELKAALVAATKERSSVEVLLRVPASTPFDRVQRAVRVVRAAGIEAIRFASVDLP
jgi:biopolymer transport protein ExbD